MILYRSIHVDVNSRISFIFYGWIVFPWASLVAKVVKNSPVMQETWVQFLGWKEPLEKQMLPTPVFLPREFQRQRSPADYSPCNCRVRHDWATNTSLSLFHCIYIHTSIFLIHSSVDRHLDCFQTLAIVSKSAVTLGYMYLFELGFAFLDIYLGVELLSHMVALFLVFWGIPILFSIVTTPIYSPSNRVQGIEGKILPWV